MLVSWALATAAWASAGAVTLHVAVHQEAGDVADVAAEGASGQCALAPSRITCPADGPVRFRWGPSTRWELTGADSEGPEVTLVPGQSSVAFVLAVDADRASALSRMVASDLTPAELRVLIDTSSAARAPPPSRSMLDALIALCEAPDPLLRQTAVELVHPWTWRSSWGPIPASAPLPVPDGWLRARVADPDPRVRRAMAFVARDWRGDAAEAAEALLGLVGDRSRKVQTPALAALSHASRADMLPAQQSWDRAFAALSRPGNPGRAAAATIARLATSLQAGPGVDPAAAVELCLLHHPEAAWRVWSAWRKAVPFRAGWVELLLRDTSGLNQRLLRAWATDDPGALAAVVRAWEPEAPHSDRYRVAQMMLGETEDLALRDALELPPLAPRTEE
jgi:hypothetical protein